MRKFLVIQQKMIGDVLTSTILCEHLKNHFPDAEIHFLINEHTTAVVEGNPAIDRIVIFKNLYRKKKGAFYTFLKAIQRERYDAVIDVYCKLESNLISWFTKAPIKISYEKWYSKFIYTHLFNYSNNEDTKLGFAIENRLLLLAPIIQKLKDPSLAPKIHLSELELKGASQLIKENDIDTSRPIFMIGILGSGPDKSYPLEYLAKVLDDITKAYKITLLFNYIPSQRNSVAQLLELCAPNTQKFIREDIFCASLRSFLALLSHCDAYIGNEGGVSNMSKALGIPNFSIFSPWITKKAWLLFNDNRANQAVHLSDYRPEISTLSKKERKANSLKFYKDLRPELFMEELHTFIKVQVLAHQ